MKTASFEFNLDDPDECLDFFTFIEARNYKHTLIDILELLRKIEKYEEEVPSRVYLLIDELRQLIYEGAGEVNNERTHI